MTNGCIQHLTVEESTSIKWAKEVMSYCCSIAYCMKQIPLTGIEDLSRWETHLGTFAKSADPVQIDKSNKKKDGQVHLSEKG